MFTRSLPFTSLKRISHRSLTVQISHIKKNDYILYKSHIIHVSDISRHAQARSTSVYKLTGICLHTGDKYSDRILSNTHIECMDSCILLTIDADRTFQTLQFAYSKEDLLHFFDDDFNEHTFPLSSLNNHTHSLAYIIPQSSLLVESFSSPPSQSSAPITLTRITIPKEQVYEILTCESALIVSTGEARKIAYKHAQIQNNLGVVVPDYVQIGDMVVVDVDSGAFLSRILQK